MPGGNRGGAAWLCVDLAAGLEAAGRQGVALEKDAIAESSRQGLHENKETLIAWWSRLGDDLLKGIMRRGGRGDDVDSKR